MEGKIGFDGLIIYSPFYFQFDIRASLYVSIAGISVCGLSVSMSLSGPTPWNVRGTATIDLWLFSIDVDFNHTWGSAKKVTIAEGDPVSAFKAAVSEPQNWSAQLALDRPSLTQLRDLRNEAAGQIVVHPGGTLEFRQNVLPLGQQIERFGNAPLSSPQRFDIKKFEVGSDSLGSTEVKEFFAKGQYFEMDSAARLSAPSFEKMKAGVSSGSLNALKLEKSWTKAVAKCEYEPLVLDEEGDAVPMAMNLKAMPTIKHQAIVAKTYWVKSFRERSPLGNLSAKRTAKTKMRIIV